MRALTESDELFGRFADREIISPVLRGPAFVKPFEIKARREFRVATMDTGTGPRPSFGLANQSSANGIEFRVPKRDPQVGRVERARVEAILPCVAAGIVSCIPETGVASVSVLQGKSEAVRCMRNDYQMHVVGH